MILKRYTTTIEMIKCMSSKRATGEPQGHNLKLTLDILWLMMKSKKKVLSGFSGSVLRNIVVGGHRFFISLKGAF